MIQTLLRLSIAAAVLLASGSVGYVQETRSPEELRKLHLAECLEEAYSVYHKAWVKGCASLPGGLMGNSVDCPLPRLIADLLNGDLNTARNLCFQKSAAGLQ
jgi:hypothetical protein